MQQTEPQVPNFEEMLAQMSQEEIDEMVKQFELAMADIEREKSVPPKPTVYKVYYNQDGSIITYTTEDLEGMFIEVTHEQYLMARHDAIVLHGKLQFTHLHTTVFKMTPSPDGEYRVCVGNMMILADDDDEDYIPHSLKAYEFE